VSAHGGQLSVVNTCHVIIVSLFQLISIRKEIGGYLEVHWSRDVCCSVGVFVQSDDAVTRTHQTSNIY